MARRDEIDEQAQPYLPDFCSARAVLAVVLISALVALVLTLVAHSGNGEFLLALSTTALFVLWLSLSSAAVLCRARGWLTRLGRAKSLVVSFLLVLLVSLAISECGWWLNTRLANQLSGLSHGEFLLRNLCIAGICAGMTMRYFYVAGEWRRNVEMESRARIRALQARIRPHFLFNSMNTIAALTRSDPVRAEEAIEDLADLFRATLGEAQHRIPLKEELEVARIYQRMEQLRLGDRLRVEWQVEELPMRALIPGLSVQPLLENAIYHGIEPIPQGGTIVVSGSRRGNGDIELRIENPVADAGERSGFHPPHKGNRVALDNIRERFRLAYDGKSSVEVHADDKRFAVVLVFPASVE